MNKDIDQQLYAQATDWLAQLHAEDQPDWDDPRLSQWLNQSEDHRLAFAEVSGYWFAAEEFPPGAGAKLLSSPVAAHRHWQRASFWFGSIVTVLLLAWIVKPLADSMVQTYLHDYHAPDGQLLSRTLADGSVITLGGDTSIDVDFSADRRRVELSAGEAFFAVTPDSKRPFSVTFPGGDVVVLGTRFGIVAHAEGALVGVVKGRVDVADQVSGAHRLLTDSELVSFSGDGFVADPRQPAELFAWTRGQLVFHQQPLEAILRRMDRYMKGRIVLLRQPQIQRRFSLVVTLSNAGQALDTLADQAGLRHLTLAGTTVFY